MAFIVKLPSHYTVCQQYVGVWGPIRCQSTGTHTREEKQCKLNYCRMWMQAVTTFIENELYVYLQVRVHICTFQPAEVTHVDQGKDGQTNPNEGRTSL